MLFSEFFGGTHTHIPSYGQYLKIHHTSTAAFRTAACATEMTATNVRLAAIFGGPLVAGSLSNTADRLSASAQVIRDYTSNVGTCPIDYSSLTIAGDAITVTEDIIHDAPFGNVIHCKRASEDGTEIKRNDPKILLLVPHSGHDMSLLEDTIRTLIPNHEVYIGRFKDADHVPVSEGEFSFNEAIDYYQTYMKAVAQHGNTDHKAHVIAVCQPGPAALLAIAKMSLEESPDLPHSFIAHASPIDTRINPTKVNEYARSRTLEWFENNVVSHVPLDRGMSGEGRLVYPKYLQRAAFMGMNMTAHRDKMESYHRDILSGNTDKAEKHKGFLSRYVDDIVSLDARFYLDTIETVFQNDLIPDNAFIDRDGTHLDISAITSVAMVAIEGEKDDITGLGQCEALLEITHGVPAENKFHIAVPEVGHFGNWAGSSGCEVLKQVDISLIRHLDPDTRKLSPLTQESLPQTEMPFNDMIYVEDQIISGQKASVHDLSYAA